MDSAPYLPYDVHLDVDSIDKIVKKLCSNETNALILEVYRLLHSHIQQHEQDALGIPLPDYAVIAALKPSEATKELLRRWAASITHQVSKAPSKENIVLLTVVLMTAHNVAFEAEKNRLLALATEFISGIEATQKSKADYSDYLLLQIWATYYILLVVHEADPSNPNLERLQKRFEKRLNSLTTGNHFPMQYTSELILYYMKCLKERNTAKRQTGETSISRIRALYSSLTAGQLVLDVPSVRLKNKGRSSSDVSGKQVSIAESVSPWSVLLRRLADQYRTSTNGTSSYEELLDTISRLLEKEQTTTKSLVLLRYGLIDMLKTVAMSCERREIRVDAIKMLLDAGRRCVKDRNWSSHEVLVVAVADALDALLDLPSQKKDKPSSPKAIVKLRRILKRWPKDRLDQPDCEIYQPIGLVPFVFGRSTDEDSSSAARDIGTDLVDHTDFLKKVYKKNNAFAGSFSGSEDLRHADSLMQRFAVIVDGQKTEQILELDALVSGEDGAARRTLVVCPPGTVEPFFAAKLTYMWSTNALWPQVDFLYLLLAKKVRARFNSLASTTKPKNLAAAIVASFCSSSESSAEFLHFVSLVEKNLRKNTTLILFDASDFAADGFREIVQEATDPDQNFRLMVLSPPSQTAKWRKCVDREVESQALTDDQILEYVRLEFLDLYASSLIGRLRQHQDVWEMVHIPGNLIVLADLWIGIVNNYDENEVTWNTLTCYDTVIRNMWNRYKNANPGVKAEYEEVIEVLGDLALDAVADNEPYITQEVLDEFSMPEEQEAMKGAGFLIEQLEGKYEFPNQSFETYFAGSALARSLAGGD